MKKKKKYFILCIDLERFLVPFEFGRTIKEKDISNVSLIGAQKVKCLLEEKNIKATFFVTIEMRQEFPEFVKSLNLEGHEIALHFDVASSTEDKVSLYKKQLENIAKTEIIGFRTHRFELFPPEKLKNLGFRYNNSVHPTFVPGRYCHILKTTRIRKDSNIWNIPASVTPLLRLPYSWVWFRNFGTRYAKLCTWSTYLQHDMVNIYFHNWDFVDLSRYKIKNSLQFVFRNTGEKCTSNLSNYLEWLNNKDITFLNFKEYLSLRGFL